MRQAGLLPRVTGMRDPSSLCLFPCPLPGVWESQGRRGFGVGIPGSEGVCVIPGAYPGILRALGEKEGGDIALLKVPRFPVCPIRIFLSRNTTGSQGESDTVSSLQELKTFPVLWHGRF